MMSMLPSLCTYRVSKPKARRFFISILVVLAILFFITDTNCLAEAIFGIPCPGCGLTRATFALLHLDFNTAFQMHPLFLLAYLDIVLIAYTVYTGKLSVFARNIFLISSVLFLGVYVYRMITMYPTIAPMKPNPHSLLNRLIELFR
jgi:cytochrome bd-type quinol oxidase subunit 2